MVIRNIRSFPFLNVHTQFLQSSTNVVLRHKAKMELFSDHKACYIHFLLERRKHLLGRSPCVMSNCHIAALHSLNGGYIVDKEFAFPIK